MGGGDLEGTNNFYCNFSLRDGGSVGSTVVVVGEVGNVVGGGVVGGRVAGEIKEMIRE